MAYKDYYQVLGVAKTATQAEIKKAYKKLARKHHPDVNPNDTSAEEKFKEINEAYQVVGKVDNRKKYDQLGEHWQQGGQGAGGQQYQRGSNQQGDADFADFFESVFGQRAQGGRGSQGHQSPFGFGGSETRYKGEDVQATLSLNLSDVLVSEKRTLSINGKNVRITVPAGVEHGQRIKLKGFGGQGANGGPSGDLYIQFNIQNNTEFKREKANLYKTVELDLYTAVLGGDLRVKTMTGEVKLKIKPGTQSGSQQKLRGQGFTKYKKDTEKGDLLITFMISIPTDLTEKQRQLFEELKELS